MNAREYGRHDFCTLSDNFLFPIFQSITVMLKQFFYSLCVIGSLFWNSCSRTSMTYIDEDVPGISPKLFAKDFISFDSISEFGSVFNADLSEFYYGVDADGKSEIRFTKRIGKSWLKPKTILSHLTYGFNDPFLSPDDQRLYYISNKPRDLTDTIEDIDIWYSERQGDQWSEPINAGPTINSDKEEYYISFTETGSLYFSTNHYAEEGRGRDFDIYRSDLQNGNYQKPIKESAAINTRMYEADVFVAPDESYLIFCSIKREGLGSGDLYICFKQLDGHWSTAKNMGAPVNSQYHELCPFVTRDGKYLFYTSNQDIYWVSTKYIEHLRGDQ